MQSLEVTELVTWVAANPDGLLVARRKRVQQHDGLQVERSQPNKSDELSIFGAGEIREDRAALLDGTGDGPIATGQRDGGGG